MLSLLSKPAFAVLPRLPLAAVITSQSQFREIMSSGLGIFSVIMFFVGCCIVGFGVINRNTDPDSAKKAYITGLLLGLAVPIVSLFFAIGGMGGAAVEPNFSR